jgi:hypothetical protein
MTSDPAPFSSGGILLRAGFFFLALASWCACLGKAGTMSNRLLCLNTWERGRLART